MKSESKINIGSFTVMFHHNWENWDILDLNKYASDNGFNFKQVDIRNKLPKDDDSVDLITCSHTIEHITRKEGKQFLSECLRVLKPNGILRITVPDSKIITQDYLSGNISRHGSHNVEVKNAEDDAVSLFHLLIAGHQTIYDYKSLTNLLFKTGFLQVEKMKYQKSKSKIIEIQTTDVFEDVSLYVEAVKPPNVLTKPVIIKNMLGDYLTEIPGDNSQISNTKTGPAITKGSLADIPNYNKQISNNKKLRIALISTPFFGCPPAGYGGLEAVVWDLAEGLDKLGHIVTLFAPEGSRKPEHGYLITTGPALDTVNTDWYQAEKNNYEIYKKYITSDKFDIVDSHTWFGFPYLLKSNDPKLKITHTMHGGLSWDSPPNW